jgi:uroporphyrinogen decarboxylase
MALDRKPLERPPVWVMRQAGRYLPEYRELREGHNFQETVRTPDLAAEISLQPVNRFGMDGAVIFADIMTPIEAMGVEMSFDPGPKLRPLTIREVLDLPELDRDRVGFVAETVRGVAAAVPDGVTVIGFAGAPLTILAYLLEGHGSKDFMTMRAALRLDPVAAVDALEKLSRSMHGYLGMQIDAGADVVQLFDTWSGLLDTHGFGRWALPAARSTLEGLGAPSIYFAPGAGHTLEVQRGIEATAYGVDWRTPLEDAWDRLGNVCVQGNLDPAILLTDPDTIQYEVRELLDGVRGRPGHVLNLGHGIDRRTPPENVVAFVEAARG